VNEYLETSLPGILAAKAGPRTLAVATISRDLESLQAELEMERD
jgi:hypothetical protein